jgi:hypothetical protein
MGKEPWTEMYRIVPICGQGVARSPVAVKRSGDGDRKMDVITAKSAKRIVILSQSALIATGVEMTHLQLPIFHMFSVLEYDPIVWLKFRCSFAVL